MQTLALKFSSEVFDLGGTKTGDLYIEIFLLNEARFKASFEVFAQIRKVAIRKHK